MDFILCLLIVVLIIILIFTNCDKKIIIEKNIIKNENFKVEQQIKPLISTFLNGSYTLEDYADNNQNKFIKFKLYNNDNNYAKIIENEDNSNKYYYIYINNLILSYNNLEIEYNLKLMIPDEEAINGLFFKYRLYKNSNNKLFFLINNTYQYLSIDTITNYLNTTEDESKALSWNF